MENYEVGDEVVFQHQGEERTGIIVDIQEHPYSYEKIAGIESRDDKPAVSVVRFWGLPQTKWVGFSKKVG